MITSTAEYVGSGRSVEGGRMVSCTDVNVQHMFSIRFKHKLPASLMHEHKLCVSRQQDQKQTSAVLQEVMLRVSGWTRADFKSGFKEIVWFEDVVNEG